MALVTISPFTWRDGAEWGGGHIQLDITFEDGASGARSELKQVVATNTTPVAHRWQVTDSRGRTDIYTLAAGTMAQPVTIPANRFTYQNGEPTWSYQFLGPV